MKSLFLTSLLGLILSVLSSIFSCLSGKKVDVKTNTIIVHDFEPIKWLDIRATTFNPTKGQTDTQPNITASGKEIDLTNPIKHRYVGLSRDLLAKYTEGAELDYGDTVIVCSRDSAFPYSGLWIVNDCAAAFVWRKKGNKRVRIPVRKTIDFLVGKKNKLGSWRVMISKL